MIFHEGFKSFINDAVSYYSEKKKKKKAIHLKLELQWQIITYAYKFVFILGNQGPLQNIKLINDIFS